MRINYIFNLSGESSRFEPNKYFPKTLVRSQGTSVLERLIISAIRGAWMTECDEVNLVFVVGPYYQEVSNEINRVVNMLSHIKFSYHIIENKEYKGTTNIDTVLKGVNYLRDKFQLFSDSYLGIVDTDVMLFEKIKGNTFARLIRTSSQVISDIGSMLVTTIDPYDKSKKEYLLTDSSIVTASPLTISGFTYDSYDSWSSAFGHSLGIAVINYDKVHEFVDILLKYQINEDKSKQYWDYFTKYDNTKDYFDRVAICTTNQAFEFDSLPELVHYLDKFDSLYRVSGPDDGEVVSTDHAYLRINGKEYGEVFIEDLSDGY